MGWLWLFVGFALGAFVCSGIAKRARQRIALETKQIDRNRLEAEGRYLDGLRRDLALRLLEDDPQALLNAHAAVAEFRKEIRQADDERRAAERKALALRYPMFTDFDLIGLYHFAPFNDDVYERRKITERYIAIGKFLALMEFKRGRVTGEAVDLKEREALERIVGERNDAELAKAIDEAMGRFYAFNIGRSEVAFEDRDYAVHRLPFDHSPEIEFGITVKATGARGVYAIHVRDDDTVFCTYSRSSLGFIDRVTTVKRKRLPLTA